jgi:DNA-binding NarL/FixJ family response regulator
VTWRHIDTVHKRSVTIDVQPWRFSEPPRALIEHPDVGAGLDLATALRRAGYAVAICRGPDAAADRSTRCPLHQLEPCAVVEGADVVVTALGFDREEAREVLRGLRARYPSTQLVVEATVAEALELEDELVGCAVVPQDADPDRVAAEVTRVLASQKR